MESWDDDEQLERSRKRNDRPLPVRRRRETDYANFDERKHSHKRSHRQRTHKDDFWDEVR
jgi:hypothetical protein